MSPRPTPGERCLPVQGEERWLPVSHPPGHLVGPSMSAGNQSSDGWLDTESDDASKDSSDALRVARGASNASSNGSDYSDDCKAGACATSSNGKIQGTRKRKTDRRQGALDQWDFVHRHIDRTSLS